MKVHHRLYNHRLSVLIAALLIAGLLAGCSQEQVTINDSESATEDGSETFTVSNAGALALTITSGVGDVQLTGADGSDVTIAYTKTAYARTEEDARAELPDVKVDIRQDGDTITIDTVQTAHTDENRSNMVELTITLPAELAGLTIEQNVGAIQLTGLSAGRLDLTANVGDITARRVTVRESAALTTDVGSIDAALALNAEAGGDYRFSTNVGDIVLTLPADSHAALDAATTVGDITTANDLSLTRVSRSEEVPAETLTGQLGDGGPLLHLRSNVGSITLRAD